MNEFDGKKFYGFSLHDDPVLSTTTRNFEFKYTRPEHLERLIQKVQQNDPEHDRNRKNEILNRLRNVKKIPHTPDMAMSYRRDADIETHVSRGETVGRVRNLSDTEINQLIGKVKSYGDLRKQNMADTYTKPKDTTKTTKPPMALKSILRTTTNEFPRGSSGSALPAAPIAAPSLPSHLYDLSEENSVGDGEMYYSEPTSEDQILCNPFDLPHEPLYEPHNVHLPHMRRELHSGLSKLPDVPEEDELFASRTVMPTVVEEYRSPQAKWVEILEAPVIEKAEVAEIKSPDDSEKSERLPTNVTYTMHSHELQLPVQISTPEMMLKNMTPPPSLPNMALTYALNSYEDNPSTYEIEDSDLEYEMIERAEYTKYCGTRPKIEELTNNSNGSGGLAEFVELEAEIPSMNLSFLKNVSPMRYSELTDEREEEKRASTKRNHMKFLTSNSATKSPSPTLEKETKKKLTKSKKKPIEETKPSPRRKTSSSARSVDQSPTPEKSSHTPRSSGKRSMANTPRQQKERSQMSANELRNMKNIVLTKSIEDLKMEKMAIFAKMTSTQERIIETLDKLRISLLELYVPDSHYEKTRRQKNAFEFSVRFSRNFLYPLKGMIEDFRIVSVEQLCSAASNEATQRVLNIFTLIHQSLQTYFKQLRYFLLDQVPQKLNTLIELTSALVSICLEKQVFDRNDAIIECLQDRCAKFLGFLEDMHEERFLTARDNYRKAGFDKTASNYSLKMFMNDLNMYEPKLVPKNHYNHRRKPKLRRVLKPSVNQTKMKSSANMPPTPKTSQMVITKPDGDQISTHINELAKSSGLFQSAQNIAIDSIAPPAEPSMNSEDSPVLNKALIEAFQVVTQEQMRKLLQPIVQTLGTVIEKKNASKTIDELLNAFSSNLISLAEGENTKRQSVSTDKVPSRAGANGDELKTSKQTERSHNRQRHSNSGETTKRNEAGDFFGGGAGDGCCSGDGDTTNAGEACVYDVSVDADDDDDDDDDDNYYVENGDDDGCNGSNVDEDDDEDDDDDEEVAGKAGDAPTDPTEPSDTNEPHERSEHTENSDSVSCFRVEYAGKNKAANNNNNNNTNNNNNNNNNNNKNSSSNSVLFDNFKLEASGEDDVASESGSDFASFEGNPSNFDVVIAMKPDKNKVNEQQQQQQQQQQQLNLLQQQQRQHQQNSMKEQQQHKSEQQQLEKYNTPLLQHQPHKPFNLSKQQQLHRLQPKPQHSVGPQPNAALRERTENYDTHIQQQQKLLRQQAYEEQLRQQVKRHSDERRSVSNTALINTKKSAEELVKQSNHLQQKLKQQLEEHQRCIIVQQQQQQQQLHQHQLQQQQMRDRENELNQQAHEKLAQQQQQKQTLSFDAPKSLTRKQPQAQAQGQQQVRVQHASRHSSRTNTSRPPSTRTSPLINTSRGQLSTRPTKSLSSSRADLHAEKARLLKKRRNPMNSPPPAPAGTPLNSARTPRSAHIATLGPGSLIGEGATKIMSAPQPSLRSTVTSNISYGGDVGAGGDAKATAIPNCTQSQVLQMCSILKSEFMDMIIPLTNAFQTAATGGASEGRQPSIETLEQRAQKATRSGNKTPTKKSESFANQDLVEALTKCLFKYNDAVQDNKGNNGNSVRGNEIREPSSTSPVTLYTGESPYEKLKLNKAQKQLEKQYQKELRRDKSKLAKKAACKVDNKEGGEHSDYQQENSADEMNNEDIDYELPTIDRSEQHKKQHKAADPVTSPCTLWHTDFKETKKKKDLRIGELIAERDQFLRACSKNRFYANPNFNQPWSVFSKLANRLSNDIISVIEEDFSIGVSKFVQDFLDNETKI